MSTTDNSLDRYIGETVPYSFHIGFVILSYAISALGAGSTLELLHRRTSLKGTYNLLFLVSAAISMQGIAIWSMHFIANRAITLLNGEPELQIVYSVRTTVASFFVPVVVLLIAFLAVSINEDVRWWRVCLAGLLSGSAICGMHYLGDASISNYRCSYNTANVVGAAVIAVSASTGALSLFFVFRNAWTNSTLRRICCAFILAGAVSGMHWCAALGTRYTLRHVPDSGESNASRNTTVIAVVCLSVAASCVMITTAVCTARTRKRYAAKAHQIVLAAAVFDGRGRILVSPDGLLPSETITETVPQKSADDIFSTAHPLFHWMYRASRNWSNVATLLDWMRTHLDRLPNGGGRGMRSVKLVQENGQLVQNSDMIIRELFCMAASTPSYRLGEVLANAGALWDEIFVTGTAGEPRPLARLGTTIEDAQARHDLLETGIRQSQDLIGRGCLLFLVRHLSAPHEIARLEASGLRFAEPRRVVDIIRSSMQIRTRRLEERLLDMATYEENKAEVEPGVYLGIFALRARLDRFGFDVLVNRESRNALPMVPLPLEKLQRWHHDFLRNLDGMAVPTLLRQLDLMKGRSLLEDQFAAQLQGGISTLQNEIDLQVCEEASLSARVVHIPCRSLSGPSSGPNTCPLITLQVILSINATVRSQLGTFVPFQLLNVRQLVRNHSPHHGVFGRTLHREMSALLSSLPPVSVERLRIVGASHHSSSSLHVCNCGFGGGKSDDELGLTENPCTGCGQPRQLDPPPLPDQQPGQQPAISSTTQPSLFGGIMVSQEIMVDVQEANQENLTPSDGGLPSRPSSAGGSQRIVAGTPKRNVLITEKRGGSGRSRLDPSIEMNHLTRATSAESAGQGRTVGAWNVEAAADEETTFLDELFTTCVKRRP
ncbi:uncharacterized protein B0I36DRAFT_395903 [Microdochium trichocladiopsis]|uniref:MHYT domain-containing protein n=1 Tax=Microdochium trichocladiopsis TaxID=1682393 RepID=A0A9P8XUV5_9PEZI|nr:uncharacterized protein B0I36DRAFT_395903 [Microdochium trichocladiopsis]KAH7016077.1 hypothetical protein B0I36DRAFT_395903 [Microdochium trichocladiopsis]